MSRQPSSDRSTRSIVVARLRPLVVALAAVVLAASSVSPAIALSSVAQGSTDTAGAMSAATAAVTGAAAGAPIADDPQGIAASTIGSAALAAIARSAGATGLALSAATPRSVPPVKAIRRPPAKATTTRPVPKPAVAASFSGRNHLWIPALGIDRSTSSFACSRSQAPANIVYRWGCAGSNNVYLLGHAYGVFKGLHDAYYNGRLKVGLTAVFADASGRIHTYRVAWWRVVRPTTDAKWAWASLATPSMTLQTCLGANSEYRLMVRLVRIG